MADPVALAVAQCGGAATPTDLLQWVTQHQLRRALARGVVERLRRGCYVLPGGEETLRAALRASGWVSHLSAAQLHGWSVRRPPDRLQLSVPRHRRLPADLARTAEIRWRSVEGRPYGQPTGGQRTVLDCARDLPFADALAVADSALRAGAVEVASLLAAAQALPRTGRSRAVRVVEAADALAANPFESVLRAHAIEAVTARFVPQLVIRVAGRRVRPDLVCADLRIVLEADSHEFHTSAAQITRDCRRYNELTLHGWLVLRFSWPQVMFEDAWVQTAIASAVAARAGSSATRRSSHQSWPGQSRDSA